MRLPSAVAALVEGAAVERVGIGDSGGRVFRIVKPDRERLFLKCAPSHGELSREAERLRWLRGKAPVPDVVAFAIENGDEYLLMTGLPGVNGVDAGRRTPEAVCLEIARA